MNQNTQPRKSLGVVSMLFPPDPEVGALRVGKLTELLYREHGWSIHVVKRACARTESIHCKDNSGTLSVESVAGNDSQAPIRWLRNFRRPQSRDSNGRRSHETQHSARHNVSQNRSVLARVSDLLVVPDNQQTWALKAYWKLRGLVRSQELSILFSSGPPHSAHLAAYWCKRRHGLPWVLDLRDPWCANPYELELSAIAKRWNHSLERRCFAQADRILTNTEPARQSLLNRYPEINPENVITLTNGIDEEDYLGLQPNPLWESTERPVFVHAGSLYSKRDPTALIRAFAKLKSSNPSSLPLLVFIGNWDESLRMSILEMIERDGLQSDIQLLPAQPRKRSLEALLAADVLMLIGDSENSQLQVPAKLFESLHLAKPILSLFKAESPVNHLLHQYCPRFEQAHPSNEEEIASALSRLSGCSSSKVEPIAGHVRPLSEISRGRQAAQLNAILDSVRIRP